MAVYGYARCSTSDAKQNVERQTGELTAQGAEIIYSEYVRGSAAIKPEQKRLFAVLKPGDTVAVTEVSRLARSVHQLCHLEDAAKHKRVKIQAGALTLDYTAEQIDPMTRAMFYMMGTFAELERGVTVERIVSGLKHAKEKGTIMGRPKKTAADVPQIVKDLLPEFQAGLFNKAEYATKCNISRPALNKYLNLLEFGKLPLVIPEKVRNMYPEYKAGKLNKSEFARQAGVARNTIKRYIAILENES